MGRLTKLFYFFIFCLLSTTTLFGQLTTDQSRALLGISSDTESMQEDISSISYGLGGIANDSEYIRNRMEDISTIFNFEYQDQFQSIFNVIDDMKYDFHDSNGQSYLMQINDQTTLNYHQLSKIYTNTLNTVQALTLFRLDFRSYFDTQNTKLRDYFNQVVDAINNRTNSVDLTLLEKNTTANTNLLEQLLLTQQGYTNQLLSPIESSYEYESQGQDSSNDSLELTAYAEEVFVDSTNQVLTTPQVEYSEYDFSFYTNLNSGISILESSYELQQALNQTNQLTQFSTQIQSDLKANVNQFDNFSKRLYSSTITWRYTLSDEPHVLDLSHYIDFSQSTMQSIWDFVIWILSFGAGIFLIKLVWERGD